MLQSDTRRYTMFGSGKAVSRQLSHVFLQILQYLGTYAASTVLALIAFYCSLLSTSVPPLAYQRVQIDRAINVLADKGYDREVWLLRHVTTFRSTDHWLNALSEKENAYASTNFPFQIVTLYGDFYTKTTDDTERAMVLLHEARHLMGEDEHQAYAYVWRQRDHLGWTLRSHGLTESYVTIEQQTRENAPEIFNCPTRPWEDCTE